MRVLFGLILGIAIGFGVFWYLRDAPEVAPAGEETAGDTNRFSDWRDRIGEWRGEEIKEELSRTEGVIRRKVKEIGAYVSDATADARITGLIKSRLALDEELSALGISVNTTDGIVTLSGRVDTYEHIGKAMEVAGGVEGVREVISTLQVTVRRPETVAE